MDKKLQHEILEFVKESNEKNGPYYNLAWQEINNKFNGPKFQSNFKFLQDDKKIQYDIAGSIIITSSGMKEFDPLYKKSWNFFKDDLAKILSVVSAILSIAATALSIYAVLKK